MAKKDLESGCKYLDKKCFPKGKCIRETACRTNYKSCGRYNELEKMPEDFMDNPDNHYSASEQLPLKP